MLTWAFTSDLRNQLFKALAINNNNGLSLPSGQPFHHRSSNLLSRSGVSGVF